MNQPRKLLMTASVWVHIRNFHLPYLKKFRALGWETHVACAGVTCAGVPGSVPYIDRLIDTPFEKKPASFANLRALRQLRRMIRQERYDLVITHTTLAAFFTRLAVWGLRDRPQLINVAHGYLFDDDTHGVRRSVLLAARRSVLLAAEKLVAPVTDVLLTMNKRDYETAQRHRLGKRIGRIPGMGVDFSRLDEAAPEDGPALRRKLGIRDDAFVLLCAAEFSKRKSQRVLIQAMQYLPERVVLVLCGDGESRNECGDLAENLDMDHRVLFPGYVSDISVWYRMADMAVSASRSEGLPFNIIEAMHMGLPVVASYVKGHTDLIEDGVTGLLYPYGEAEACAERVKRLMEDEKLRRNMSARAGRAVDCYDLKAVLPVVIGEYLR